MSRPRFARSALLVRLLVAGPLLAGAGAADAQSFALTMQGAFDGRSALVIGGVPTPFTGVTPFSLTAYFSTTTPNLVAPLPFAGFVAYAPSLVELTLGGRTYTMQSFSASTRAGVSVAIFDATTPFFPGRYGVGLIADPLADGAGWVADYSGASPAFTLGSGGVVPATFTGYNGVGVSSGVCIVGTPGNCQQQAITPIPMTWNGQTFALQLGSYEEDGAPFTAVISAVPEPAPIALLAAGLAGVAVLAGGARRLGRRSSSASV